jgi:hypothetical protein
VHHRGRDLTRHDAAEQAVIHRRILVRFGVLFRQLPDLGSRHD